MSTAVRLIDNLDHTDGVAIHFHGNTGNGAGFNPQGFAYLLIPARILADVRYQERFAFGGNITGNSLPDVQLKGLYLILFFTGGSLEIKLAGLLIQQQRELALAFIIRLAVSMISSSSWSRSWTDDTQAEISFI